MGITQESRKLYSSVTLSVAFSRLFAKKTLSMNQTDGSQNTHTHVHTHIVIEMSCAFANFVLTLCWLCADFEHLHTTCIFGSFSLNLTFTHSHHAHSFKQTLSLSLALAHTRACMRVRVLCLSLARTLSFSLRVCVCLSLSLQIQEQPAGVLDLLLDALEEYHLSRKKTGGEKWVNSARVYVSGCLLETLEEYHPKIRGEKEKKNGFRCMFGSVLWNVTSVLEEYPSFPHCERKKDREK